MSAPIVTTADYTLILDWLARIEQRGDSGHSVRQKLDHAVIVASEDVPDDVVTLDSLVRFRIGGWLEFDRVLVAGNGRKAAHSTLPLDNPRGLALLGMRAGQSATVDLLDDSEDTIEVLSILDQPEARRATPAADPATAVSNPSVSGGNLGSPTA